MSKHTPLTFENSGLVDCVFRGRERVAEMIGPDGESLGKLFAAAPEMLEALEMMAEYWQNGSPVCAGSEVAKDAIAAIAKARGE